MAHAILLQFGVDLTEFIFGEPIHALATIASHQVKFLIIGLQHARHELAALFFQIFQNAHFMVKTLFGQTATKGLIDTTIVA